jgi:hypothetical protein
MEVLEDEKLMDIFEHKRGEVQDAQYNCTKRNCITHTAHHILGDQVKVDQMGRACSSPGEEEKFLHGLGGKLEGRRLLRILRN